MLFLRQMLCLFSGVGLLVKLDMTTNRKEIWLESKSGLSQHWKLST